MKVFLGVLLIVLAVAVAVVPYFGTCQHAGRAITTSTGATIPMKCYWTARAEIGVGVPLAVVGALFLASRRRESQAFLAVLGAALGAVAILIPTRLIGVCATLMPCHTVMRPFLLAAGTAVIAACALGLVLTLRRKEKAA